MAVSLPRAFVLFVFCLGAAGDKRADAQTESNAIDVTFIFTNDVHACRMASGLSLGCAAQGKTDDNLLRHIDAINKITESAWPADIGGMPTGLERAGQKIDTPLGVVVGGDLTDDGGGQVTLPSEGTQLLQFSHRYQQGVGPDRVHFPVYLGLGNHDLDQDGPPQHGDWYRRELRDFVEINHRPGVFFKPPVPASNYDVDSDSYSWDWGGLHLVQLHRFGGDTRKSAVSGLAWLKNDLAANASDGKPVILFQHYGWDGFSTERWDSAAKTFDDEGEGDDHWWSEAERQALLDILAGYNVIGLFHGHQHDVAMIYQHAELDLFKPKAAYIGGFAVVRVTENRLEVVLAETAQEGGTRFTNAFTKPVKARR